MVSWRTFGYVGFVSVLYAAGGCGQEYPRPPVTVAQYSVLRGSERPAYPRHTIVQYNLRRALDVDLRHSERLDSLRLVAHLGGGDPAVRTELVAVLSEKDSPADLRDATLEFLIRTGGQDIDEQVLAAMSKAGQQVQLREAILTWLAKHPQPAVLAKIVKFWAQEPTTTGLNEPRYRLVVEKISGKKWDEALLDGINSPGFFARGSAMEVLFRRMPLALLRLRISRAKPKTEAMLALKTFANLFGYLPANRAELLATVSMYKTKWDLFQDTARLNRNWRANYGYVFNIRDFHLLSRLARDPLRTNLRRTHLILELGKTLGARKHVQHTPSKPGAVDDYIERFWLQIDSLAMSDLWLLRLLNEMLTRPRVQMALKIMADRDRADRQGAWGGLVFYENGQAEAKLYPRPRGSQDDLAFAPGEQLVLDGRDALCRFHAHFEKIGNSSRAGPDAKELTDAKRENYCGLIITSISKNGFCAHYYNPQGVVVSLGTFPFRW